MSGGRQDVVRRSRRQWGWHRLTDEWARRLVDRAEVCPRELVLDLGAGQGALVGPLLAAGATVVAVELHGGRARQLRERWPDALESGALRVVQRDLLDLWLPQRPFRVVANPPFAIGSALLAHLLRPGSRLVSADLVLPRAVAHRWVTGDVPAARRWQRVFDCRVATNLPRAAFRPPPRVDTAIVVLRRHPAVRLR